MYEYDFKKNIFGFVLIISGAHIIIALNLPGFADFPPIGLMMIGVFLAIVGLSLAEAIVKGSALIYAGILMLVCELLFQSMGGHIPSPRLLLWIGIPILIIGIILSVKGFREN